MICLTGMEGILPARNGGIERGNILLQMVVPRNGELHFSAVIGASSPVGAAWSGRSNEN